MKTNQHVLTASFITQQPVGRKAKELTVGIDIPSHLINHACRQIANQVEVSAALQEQRLQHEAQQAAGSKGASSMHM